MCKPSCVRADRQDVSDALAKHKVSLRRLFLGVSASDGRVAGRKELAVLLNFDEWRLFFRECKLVGPDLTERDAKLVFTWARMAVVGESSLLGQLKERGDIKEVNLPFEGFCECICRLAILKSLPTDAEIKAAETSDAGMYIRHLCEADEAAYGALITSRGEPWPGAFHPRQSPGRCVDHMVMMIIRTVQGGAEGGPCGSGSAVCDEELSQSDVDNFSKSFLAKL